MPQVVLLAAFVGSLVIHAAALFLPEVDLSTASEPMPIVAEIQAPPTAPPSVSSRRPAERLAKKHAGPKTASAKHRAAHAAGNPAIEPPMAHAAAVSSAAAAPVPQPQSQPEPMPAITAAEPAAPAADPKLPAHGFIRFAVYKGSQGLMVGRAEHRWDFADGNYRLSAVTETVGLAALFKPVNIELESRGKVTADGLRPEIFRTRRNGAETRENADFDWEDHHVILARDGSQYGIGEDAQDLLSFHYQLAYLPNPEDGAVISVATGKKFERYRFNALGEEEIDIPAGHFRVLHVRVQTDSTTDLWLALEQRLLPLKIRHTDRKGESFEQVATEIGI